MPLFDRYELDTDSSLATDFADDDRFLFASAEAGEWEGIEGLAFALAVIGKAPWGSKTVSVDATNGSNATGARGKPWRPFASIDYAIAAAAAGDTVLIGPGTFASPTTEKAGLRYVGSGRPTFDSLSAPTALQHGTVLQGPWTMSLAGQQVYDLGIDCGSAVCAAGYGGAAQEGLAFAQGSPSSVAGFAAHNVAVLCRAADSAVHALRVENVRLVTLTNVETYYGVHGVTLKGSDLTLRGHRAWGHGQDSLIIKADTGQTVRGVRCHDLYYRNGLGVVIQGAGGTFADAHLAHVIVEDCGGVGINVLGTTNIDRLTVRGYDCTRPSGGSIDAGFDSGQLTGVLANLIIADAYLHGGVTGFGTAGLRIGGGANASTTLSLLSNVVQRNAGAWGGLLYGGVVQLQNCNFGNTLYVSPANPVCTAYAPPGAVVAAAGVNGTLVQTGP